MAQTRVRVICSGSEDVLDATGCCGRDRMGPHLNGYNTQEQDSASQLNPVYV